MSGYGEARPIGRMVPQQAPQERPPAATCARCECNLSRYRDHWQHHCLTCQQVLVDEGALRVPAFEPADTSAERTRKAATKPTPLAEQKRGYRNLSTEDRILTGKYDVCADCKKELKLKRAQRCTGCAALARRTVGPGSRFCECGNTKGTSNEKCMTCRYPNSARAQLRRLNQGRATNLHNPYPTTI